ncbi:MAG: dihydrolipoyl dehydrogenase [Deltaproteobacteria bacterium]|nr:dihydrolipoyl dehydrogenase [Deltaproteobacteria bacterium]
MSENYDMAVIGGGPGGYAAAVLASRQGLKTALVERESLGGVCANWGCVPTKALLRNAEVIHLLSQGRTFGFQTQGFSADYQAAQKRSRQVSIRQVRRVEALVKSCGIALHRGEGVLAGGREILLQPEGKRISAEHVVLATGARPRQLPGLPCDGERVISFRQALQLTEAPAKVVVIGAGPIGMEFATLWARYGSQVTVVEMLPRILPLEDAEISAEAAKAYQRVKIRLMTSAAVHDIAPSGQGVTVEVEQGKGRERLAADKVLVAIGFEANSGGLGLEEAGVALERGRVVVDGQMRTTQSHVFAVGDVTGKLGLAHTASAQAFVAVQTIAGRPTRPLVYTDIPRCTYTSPEIASVGLTQVQAEDRGHAVTAVTSPLAPNGKAVAMNEAVGLVKIVADANSHQVLGVHMMGPHVTEMIAGAAGALSQGLTVGQMASVVYPHPTVSEALMEGLHALAGHAVHI